jgi:hypothetical protein
LASPTAIILEYTIFSIFLVTTAFLNNKITVTSSENEGVDRMKKPRAIKKTVIQLVSAGLLAVFGVVTNIITSSETMIA